MQVNWVTNEARLMFSHKEKKKSAQDTNKQVSCVDFLFSQNLYVWSIIVCS